MICRSTKDTGPPSDSDPASPLELLPDEPTGSAMSKRKTGTTGRKQPPAPKDFDPFEEDMDDGGGDTVAATKRHRHGLCSNRYYWLLMFLSDVNKDLTFKDKDQTLKAKDQDKD